MIFNDVKGSMDKQDPEESTDPKDPSKLGDRSEKLHCWREDQKDINATVL